MYYTSCDGLFSHKITLSTPLLGHLALWRFSLSLDQLFHTTSIEAAWVGIYLIALYFIWVASVVPLQLSGSM